MTTPATSPLHRIRGLLLRPFLVVAAHRPLRATKVSYLPSLVIPKADTDRDHILIAPYGQLCVYSLLLYTFHYTRYTHLWNRPMDP